MRDEEKDAEDDKPLDKMAGAGALEYQQDLIDYEGKQGDIDYFTLDKHSTALYRR